MKKSKDRKRDHVQRSSYLTDQDMVIGSPYNVIDLSAPSSTSQVTTGDGKAIADSNKMIQIPSPIAASNTDKESPLEKSNHNMSLSNHDGTTNEEQGAEEQIKPDMVISAPYNGKCLSEISYEPLDLIPGYEDMVDHNTMKSIPPPEELSQRPDAVPFSETKDWTIASLTENIARQAFLEYANNHYSYRTALAREMVIQKLTPLKMYKYRLETYTESRVCKWNTEPYKQQVVDSPASGPAPQPWEIPVKCSNLFMDEELNIPVPHTSSKKACSRCSLGRIRCTTCYGIRTIRCLSCGGIGRLPYGNCYRCIGGGWITCTTCNGTSCETCTRCSGHAGLVIYIQLNITWKNNIIDCIADYNSEIPAELVHTMNGKIVFTDEQNLVPPLVNFPLASINQASRDAPEQHDALFSSSCRVLRQRQSIEWLPLTKVEYAWKGKEYSYFVYGNDNKVYADNYPQKCHCVIQ